MLNAPKSDPDKEDSEDRAAAIIMASTVALAITNYCTIHYSFVPDETVFHYISLQPLKRATRKRARTRTHTRRNTWATGSRRRRAAAVLRRRTTTIAHVFIFITSARQRLARVSPRPPDPAFIGSSWSRWLCIAPVYGIIARSIIVAASRRQSNDDNEITWHGHMSTRVGAAVTSRRAILRFWCSTLGTICQLMVNKLQTVRLHVLMY